MSQRICPQAIDEACSVRASHAIRVLTAPSLRRDHDGHRPAIQCLRAVQERTRIDRAAVRQGRPVAVLELTNISKHFGAIQAVNDVSLSLEPGEVVGLMGDNGAGKSTLVKIIAGNFRPTHGTMQMDGQELSMHRPVEARRHGIEIVYQDLALCNNLTAAANVFLGREIAPRHRPVQRSSTMPAMYRRAGQLFAELKSETRPRDLVKQMSGGQRQAVAIARTMLSRRQDRADGRADRGDLGAPGRRGAEPDPAPARPGHRRRADQPPHARRVPVADRVVVLRRGRKVADKAIAASSPEEVTGLITGAIEQVVKRRMSSKPMAITARSDDRNRSSTTGCSALLGSQTFWVLVASSWPASSCRLRPTRSPPRRTSSTSPATSPSSRSSRSA